MAADSNPPLVTGVPVRSVAYAGGSIQPFSGVTIADGTPGANDIVELMVQTGDATLMDGAGFSELQLDQSSTAYTSYYFSGSPAQVTAEVDALMYTSTRFGNYYQLALNVTDTLTDRSTFNNTAIENLTGKGMVSIDPSVSFASDGSFTLSAKVSDPSDLANLEFYAVVNGVETDLGAAIHGALDAPGVYSVTEDAPRGTQTAIMAVETDRFGGTETAMASFELTKGVQGEPYVAEQDLYDPDTGAFEGQTFFRANGTVEGSTAYASDGTELTSTIDLQDGRRIVDVLAPGQTVYSEVSDVFRAHETGDNRFVFDPGFGNDVVNGFVGTRPSHDTVVLQGSDFRGNTVAQKLAAVLHNTQDGSEGAVISDPSSGDNITLVGVTKVQLVNNREDFALHA